MRKIQKLLFYLILIVFPLGQLLRFRLNFLPQSVKVQPIEIIVFLFSFARLINFRKTQEKIYWPSLFWKMTVFGLIAAFSLIIKMPKLSFVDILPAFLYLLRLWNFFLFYLAMVNFLIKERLPIIKFLFWEGIAISFFALGQYLILPDTRFLFNYGWDEHYFRAIGSFLDPGFTGLLVSLAFAILLINKFNLKNVLLGSFLLTTIGLTFSRATYLSLFSGLIAFSLIKKRFRLYLLLFIFTVLVLILPKPGGEGVDLLRINSILARSENYYQALSIIKKNFWLGVGFNAYRTASKNLGYLSADDWQITNAGAGADNSFLFVWAITGIIGFIFFVAFWMEILRESYHLVKESKSAQVVFISIIMITVSSLFSNVIFYPWIFIWLAAILAEFTVDISESTRVRSYFAPGQRR